jgi:hypothetical protein
MYSDEDLQSAVDAGIFSKQSVQQFRKHFASQTNRVAVDEENFRLVSSFNDIYVVIACTLMLISLTWFGRSIDDFTGALLLTIGSWLLAEYFVLKRHMAFPAIVLLISFLSGIAASVISFFNTINEPILLLAGCVCAVSAWLHWKRFQVPITIAGGAATFIGCILAITVTKTNTNLDQWFIPMLLLSGISTFCFAMFWDKQDRLRVTRKSDVAFWLHLLSAPLIVHPIFSLLGILEGNTGLFEAGLVICLYILMAMVAVAIDRRAILVSGLIYVLYAISTVLKTVGIDASSTSITGIIIGGALLLLSVYWQRSRIVLFKLIPNKLQPLLPPLKN